MTPQSHLPRPTHLEPPAHAPNAALLIDFDNVTMAIRSDLQTELKRLLQSDIIKGKVAVQRAYADWRRYQQYVVPLAESSIDLIFAPAYGSNKKNATDIRLAIDALELVFTRPEIGTFILLSGDSDFSALVLKLKEYGKYVIGVGIRESSSDLLIQNCDEYYSYNELAGFTKESEVEYVRRDPWDLVVEAVKQMTAHNDVMRSDRLKQVMQEIDPNFSEKDLGYSRFSKFVVDAAHKGLINLTKLENGQYEIALGAGVPGAAAQPALGRASSRGGPRAEAPRERDERAQVSRRRSEDGRARRGGSLGDAFGLLKQALSRLGGGDKPVSADALRDTMIELKGDAGEPLEPERFPKLLRQAHDAEIIDLSKEEDGAYAVKLRDERSAAAALEPAEPVAAGDFDDANDPPMPASSAPPSMRPEAPPTRGGVGGVPSRSARFRRGSRGPRVAPPEIPKIGVVEVDPNFKPRIELIPVRPVAPEPMGTESHLPAPAPAEDDRREQSGGRGRGGRGRRGGSGRSQSAESAGERELGERERSGRGRRGGRGGGRGGRGRSGGEGRTADERTGAQAPAPPPPPPPPPSAPLGPATARESERPAPEPAGEGEGGGESFWSKVKRGLTGGA
ncbi:MAG TPA: NYN domain-containing protein [Gemmatimonadales bacterium]|nr:NYN domain-containing protein [Gemmatimonadales bacterium]